MKWIREKILTYCKHTDHCIWLACILVSAIGCVLLWGIVQSGYQRQLSVSMRNLAVQMAAIGLGVAAAFVLSNVNYNILKKTWVIHVPLTYGLVLLTFLIGTGAAERPDDKRWLVIPNLDVWIQPAELLKISFILIFAYHIVKLGDAINKPYNVALLGVHMGVPVLLIHFQGDDGTALLIAAIAVAMLFVSRLYWRYIVGAGAAAVAALPLVWMYVLNNFQKQRILALFNQDEADITGWYYQQYKAKIAMAMGGDTGIGLTGVNHVYIPEMHTDFIFAFLCESFGFMGALGVVALMVLLCLKILYNSHRATDSYGQLLCIGVFAMILFQFVVNVGMCLSLFPVIGNPFPFLSYGGSSMLTNFLGIGLVQSVYMFRKKSMFADPEL